MAGDLQRQILATLHSHVTDERLRREHDGATTRRHDVPLFSSLRIVVVVVAEGPSVTRVTLLSCL
jgi:hypothetical protein